MLADTMVLEISSAFVRTVATTVAVNPTILSYSMDTINGSLFFLALKFASLKLVYYIVV